MLGLSALSSSLLTSAHLIYLRFIIASMFFIRFYITYCLWLARLGAIFDPIKGTTELTLLGNHNVLKRYSGNFEFTKRGLWSVSLFLGFYYWRVNYNRRIGPADLSPVLGLPNDRRFYPSTYTLNPTCSNECVRPFARSFHIIANNGFKVFWMDLYCIRQFWNISRIENAHVNSLLWLSLHLPANPCWCWKGSRLFSTQLLTHQ